MRLRMSSLKICINKCGQKCENVHDKTYQSGMSVLPIMEAKLMTGLRATQAL